MLNVVPRLEAADRFLRGAGLGVCTGIIFSTVVSTGVFAPTLAHAQTSVIELSTVEARALAQRAFFAGDRQLAYQIARELVQAMPEDRDLLMLLAASAPDAGAPEEGREAGARAFALSTTGAQRYEAARITAIAAARAGQLTRATFWLRRALIHAPTEEERARTTRDAAEITRRNPLTLRFSAAIVPSDNVNGGAEDDTLTAPGLPDGTLSPDALALAGLRATLRLGATWRLAETADGRTSFSVDYSGARVRIDDEEAGVSDSAFASDIMSAALAHERRLGIGTAGIRLGIGDYDYGFEEYYDYERITLSYGFAPTETLFTSLSVQREWQDYVSPGIDEITKTGYRGTLVRRLASGDRVSGTLSHEVSDGRSVNYTYTDTGLQLGYRWGEPFGPVTVGVAAGVRWTDYPEYALIFPVEGGREDRTYTYSFDLGFPDAEFAGFSPSVTFSGSVAESNISRFTRSTMSGTFGFQSRF